MSEQLDRLIAAVEAGIEYIPDLKAVLEAVWPPHNEAKLRLDLVAVAAFDGSLDAANKMHDAIIPGWEWLVGCDKAEVWRKDSTGYEVDQFESFYPSIARAWLLAILKAYRASRTTQGDAS